MTKPITPEDAAQRKVELIPDFVYEVVNDLIAKKLNSNQAIIYVDEIVDVLNTKFNVSSQACFDNHYLDIEKSYRDSGWIVAYDQPTYNESFKAYFKFTKKK